MNDNKDSPGIRLAVKVMPNSGRNEITGFKDGVLQVRVAVAPEKGKANKALTDFLADKLGIRKSSIIIIKGQTSRHKVIFIKGISDDDLSRLI